MIGRILDSVIGVFNPAAAARRAASRIRFEALSTYSAAERSRRNKDWNPKNVSADAAILGDFETVMRRARSLQRDNWAGRSICRAFGRNVVGRGITPASVAKDDKGKELRDFNQTRDELFMHWASRAKFCDIERKQTFWRKQKMAVEETVAVGQHFIVWSYVPNPETVGLRLQSFEPEQLDFVRLVNPDTGFQIRRGIEVDDHGAAVAYWFYERPLNDYYGFQPAGISGSLFYESKRIEADRVFHIFDQERTRQTHGFSWYAPVMQKIRDTQTMDDALLLKAKLEASVGLIINRNPTSAGFGGAAGEGDESLPARNDGDGSDDVSRDGGRQMAFEPAMVFEGMAGETIQGMPMQSPGANYDPFMRMNLRTAGAGVGLSYDVIARDYDQGSYSSKRQAALEDRREYGWIQDGVVDTLCQGVIELFTYFAWLEGKLDVPDDDFLSNTMRYNETEWVPDGFDWIDPQKEATAASIRLDKRLDTRKSIIAGRGGNWRRTFQQLADEQAEAKRVGIVLPDVEPTPSAVAGDGPPDPGADGEDKLDPAKTPPKLPENPQK